MTALISLVTLFLCVLTAFCLAQQTTISFSGGYHHETIPADQRDNPFHIELDLRSSGESGVVLLATLQTSSDYIALVMDSSAQLQVVVKLAGQLTVAGSTNFTQEPDWSEWRNLKVGLVGTMLTVMLQGHTFTTYTLSSPSLVSEVYFGGPETFFSSRYADMPVRNYYVGCMRNITLNSELLVVELSGHGVDYGCCIIPRYQLWCVDSSHPNLTTILPSLTSSSEVLTVSFGLRLKSKEDGLILLSHASSVSWSVALLEGQLQVMAQVSSAMELAVRCPGYFLNLEEWHHIQVMLSSTSISCSVDGDLEMTSLSQVVPISHYYPTTLRVGGALSGLDRGFTGCLQRLRLDERDVDAGVLSEGEAEAAVQPALIPWDQFSFNTTHVVVGENMEVILSTDHIQLQLPRDEFSDALTAFYQREVENAIHFEALPRHQYGHIFIGHAAAVVNRFQYKNLLSGDPEEQVGYLHLGQENISLPDVLLFRVWAGCGALVLSELEPHLPLIVSVEEHDDIPLVQSFQDLTLAVGTRRVITPEMLTVQYPPVINPALFSFRVQHVSVQNSSCEPCPERVLCQQCQGGILMKNNSEVMFFSQEDINRGMVAFQHFARFGTSPVVIELEVTVQTVTVDARVHVVPHEGSVELVADGGCLFVKAGNVSTLQTRHLNATTTFPDQTPVITYDLLQVPAFGVLQRYDTVLSEWLDLTSSTATHPPLFEISSLTSFTQADINQGHVRYVHSEPFLTGVEEFQFQLRSYNLSGGASSLCIHIVPAGSEILTELTVSLVSLVVVEGGVAPINHSVLNTSLHGLHQVLPMFEPEYTLVETPSYGELELRGAMLAAGDVFKHSDLASNSLVYIHGGAEQHHDLFSFYVEADISTDPTTHPIQSPNRTSNLTLAITVTAVNNHQPVVQTLQDIRVPEGCWITITPSHINITDEDRPSERIKIHLKMRGDYHIGFFALISNSSEAISHFFMEDVLEERVIFVHPLNLSAPLNYSQTLRMDDGLHNHTIRQPVVVSAIPLELQVSVASPPLPDAQCLNADDASPQLRFSASHFTATLLDHYGNNANKVPHILVRVKQPPTHGQIFLRNNFQHDNGTLLSVSQFQFRDMSHMVYLLEERTATQDHWELEFSYGHSEVVVQNITLCIQPVLVPLTFHTTPLQLTHMEGTGEGTGEGIGRITTTELRVTASRNEEIDSLYFEIVRSPEHGRLLDDRMDDLPSLSRFSYADLRLGHIIYELSNMSGPGEDVVHLNVCSPYLCLESQILQFEIRSVPVEIKNFSTIHVREGDFYQLSVDDFDISAPPGYSVFLLLQSQPRYGELVFVGVMEDNYELDVIPLDVINQGWIHYNNSEPEQLQDFFEMRVQATPKSGKGDAVVVDVLVRIEIEPVNNHAPEPLVRPLTVVDGSLALVSSSILWAHDPDVGTESEDLVWINTLKDFPSKGYFLLDYGNGTTKERVTTWTGDDISNNRLYYQHVKRTPDNRVDFLSYIVSDGEKNRTSFLGIVLVAVDIKRNDSSASDPFWLKEGSSERINQSHLNFCAENDHELVSSSFVITVLEPPRHGNLTLNGVPATSFTQDHIESDEFVYSHDGSNSVEDQFKFRISVPERQNGSANATFRIVIAPVDDDPPVVNITGDLFVLQGERVDVTSDTIDIIDHDLTTKEEIDLLKCHLVRGLSQGKLVKTRFGEHYDHTVTFTKYDLVHDLNQPDDGVWYEHLPTTTPIMEPEQLVFNVTDGINHQPEIYNLTIYVIPQKLTLTVHQLVVTENEKEYITETMIQVNHHYLRGVEGIIHVTVPPRHGNISYANNSSGPLKVFTTEEMKTRSIVYYHSGSETLTDSVTFTYTAKDPAHFDRQSDNYTLAIEIIPVEDNPPTLLSNNTNLTMWTYDTIHLQEKYLNVTDRDSAPGQLKINVSISGLGGFVAFSNGSRTRSFTQADLQAHKVVFVHEDGRKGRLQYTVTDGVHAVSGSISIYADPLELECDTTQWESIEVEFLKTHVLTASNLHCVTTDTSTSREFIFSIPHSLLGHFEVNAIPVLEFNSTVLAAGLVTYVHTETAIWREGESLSVSVQSRPASPVRDLPLNVIVSYPRPPPGSRLAVNTGLNMSEGSNHTLTLNELDARNLRYQAWTSLQTRDTSPADLVVEFRVPEPPQHGQLTLNAMPVHSFTQADLELASSPLLYAHDNSETESDKLVLNVVVLLNGQSIDEYSSEVISIRIDPVNDHHPILRTTNREKTLIQEHQTFLSVQDLEIQDLDNDPEQLWLVLVSLPSNTHMQLGEEPLLISSSFTQRDINQHRVLLFPNTVGLSTFSFTFTDGLFSSEDHIEFTLVVEQHTLQVVTLNKVTYTQNQRGVHLTNHHLNTLTNGNRSLTVFNVTLAPKYGRLMIEGSEVDGFTQLDLDASRVHYTPHERTQKHNDSFSLAVINRKLEQRVKVAVRVLAWGRTSHNTTINFSHQLAQPLPPDVLVLEQQVSNTGNLPTITIIRPPTFGHLELRPPVDPGNVVSKRFTGEVESFNSNDLQRGWIVYVWDYPDPIYNTTVEESFTVLVKFDGMQPGEAVIQLTVYPPSPPASQVWSTVSTSKSAGSSTTSFGTGSPPAATAASEGSGFPVYILIPTLGIIIFLLILIFMVLIFCLKQQKKVKKWSPSLSPVGHQSPWSSASPPVPMHDAHYDYDPSAMPTQEDHEVHNSDTSSGFSEPEVSPRHTPVHPMYSSPRTLAPSPTFQPPRSRMRRNVSITFSSRHSTASEMSLEPSQSLYSSHPPRSTHSGATAQVLPVRPASHAAFTRPLPAAVPVDSGVVSLQSQPETYSPDLPQAPSDGPSPTPHQEDLTEWNTGEKMPDFSDPNVQRLFHAQNPVLKKEEYWV